MAGEAIVSSVVADMVGRALSLLAGHLLDQQPDRGADAKLPRLRHLLVRVESVAEAAGARWITSHALLAWLAELVYGAYRGRYLLDALPSRAGQDEGHGKLVRARSFSLPSSFNPSKRLRVAARRLLLGDADELDAVLANLERVAGGLTEFIMLLQMCPPAPHRPLPVTGMYADSLMFGRHAERRRVLDFLLRDDESGEPAVAELGTLPIIGAPGLGRTTLVQHVCEDPAVRRRFSLVIMLDFHCMSLMATGETELLLRSLFAPSASSVLSSGDGEKKLSLLERKLRGERFLAVFDNVDTRRRLVVDAIMPTLRRAGRRGSKVIVTSTDAELVAGLGTVVPIELRPLPREEYWFFFRAHAFGDGAEPDPQLAAAGQAIAKKLRGSFLGGKIVGALLRSRPDAGLWRSVLNSSSVSVADVSCCLGNGSYVETVAGELLPPHVTVSCVTVSGSPMKGHVGIQDSSLALPAPSSHDDHRPELPVLLCKSVFPSYCLYYTAHCTIDKEINQ
uniref:Uncharacterized protein n=1 Tax=Avena sativa TaxID=4498 RepID=A0ACD5Z0L5_AVESA